MYRYPVSPCRGWKVYQLQRRRVRSAQVLQLDTNLQHLVRQRVVEGFVQVRQSPMTLSVSNVIAQ